MNKEVKKIKYPGAVAVDSTGTLYTASLLETCIFKRTLTGEMKILADTEFYVGSLAVDSKDNVYVAVSSNNQIRKITSSGIINVFVGDGEPGFKDGTASVAQFNYPCGVAVDSSGNVYVADSYNERIRKITPAGVVSTLAGSGEEGFIDGSSSTAQFNTPCGVAVDSSGNVYVADSANHRIRKITPSGIVNTFAGSGKQGFKDGTGSTAQFNYPYGIAVNPKDNIYVADTYNCRIREITPAGVVSTLAGSGEEGFIDGSSDVAQFDYPMGISVDSKNNVYIADHYNHRIRRIKPNGIVMTNVF